MLCMYVDLLIDCGKKAEDPLFPNLKGNGKTIIKDLCISSDNARNVLKKTLVKVGLPASLAMKFGLHSFRMGAVQTALSLGQLLEVEVQKAGRWKSAGTVNKYYVQTEKDMCKFSKVISGSIL